MSAIDSTNADTVPASLPATGIALDVAELRRARAERIAGIAKWVLPLLVLAAALGYWEWTVWYHDIKPYLLPSPSLIFVTLIADWKILEPSLINTLIVTFGALSLAVIGGGGLAVLFAQSRWVEMAFIPFAITLQVTPVVAISPLIVIYLKDVTVEAPFGLFTISDVMLQLLACSWVVAFFPVLSNTTIGLNSADHNLRNMFELYGASRWQTLRYLRLPAALPYFLAGLKISSGLSLVGAVVAEFVVGSQGSGSGLASRIAESAYHLKMPRMFAALVLISVTGIVIYLVTSWCSHLLLRRWHESALRREN